MFSDAGIMLGWDYCPQTTRER